MKNNTGKNSLPKTPAQGNKPRPEIRDNLDSRENQENFIKGNDSTHNKKETKENHLKKKKDDN